MRIVGSGLRVLFSVKICLCESFQCLVRIFPVNGLRHSLESRDPAGRQRIILAEHSMDFPSWLISYVCTSPQRAVWLAHNQGIGFGMGVRPRDRVRCGGTTWVGDLTEQMDAVPGSHTDLQLAPWSILVILVRPLPRGVVLVVFEGWGALAARFRCGSRWPSLVHLRLLAIDEVFLQIVSVIVVDTYPFCSLSHISEHKGGVTNTVRRMQMQTPERWLNRC